MSKAGKVRVSFLLASCPSLKSEKEHLDKPGCAGPSPCSPTLLTVLTTGGDYRLEEKGEKGFMSWSCSKVRELNFNFDHLAR